MSTDEERVHDGTGHAPDEDVHERISSLGCWRGQVRASVLGGGITNRNYRVQDDEGKYVVRLGDDIPVHQILRFNELSASRAAHAAGIAPAVLFHEPGVLVLEFIDSEPLSPERVRDPENLPAIVELIRRCHQDVPLHLRGASLVFWVFHVVRDYAATLRDSDSPYQSRLNDWLDAARMLEHEAGPFDMVFGHNDLLAGNMLDDGNRLWLIDWEYAGFNSPLFDLGGLASNNELTAAAETRMLELYYSEPLTALRWRQYQAMKCASLLRETLWSMVSEIHSQLDFDYASYSRDNLQRFERALQDFDASRGM
ncbi:MAG: phosphotransferase [Granulosicoccus sp.]|nr:phosphotransferase [Granulosicoccus sp.]